ncbi:MAG: hypothetical protein HYS67_01440 [Deltaproteobacteria bacterium]|nr:hypothetical protein [Deltaproteobacteria bacterium]
MKKTESKKVLNGEQIKQSLERFCRDILREHKSPEQLAFIGIRTRGIYLAKRLGEMIKRREGREVPVGEMDIALYRDDLNTLLPEGRVDHTRIPFDVANKSVILVDDVLQAQRGGREGRGHHHRLNSVEKKKRKS